MNRVGEHHRERQLPARETAIGQQGFTLIPQLSRHRRRGGLTEQLLKLAALLLTSRRPPGPAGHGHQGEARHRHTDANPRTDHQQADAGHQQHDLSKQEQKGTPHKRFRTFADQNAQG